MRNLECPKSTLDNHDVEMTKLREISHEFKTVYKDSTSALRHVPLNCKDKTVQINDTSARNGE